MYFISLFSPGRNYAGLVSKRMDFDAASQCVANIILSGGEHGGQRVTKAIERQAKREGEMLCAYAPSKITLPALPDLDLDGGTLYIDREPRHSC